MRNDIEHSLRQKCKEGKIKKTYFKQAAGGWILIFAPLDPWEEEGSESELFP